jgi:hypothetical protein
MDGYIEGSEQALNSPIVFSHVYCSLYLGHACVTHSCHVSLQMVLTTPREEVPLEPAPVSKGGTYTLQVRERLVSRGTAE